MYENEYNKSLGCSAISLASGIPVSMELLKLHCRVDGDDEDAILISYANAAKNFIEKHTNRAFIEQTYKESYGYICGHSLALNRFPVNEIVDVQYLDGDNAWQTLSSDTYTFTGANVVPSVFELNSDESWPSFGNQRERLRITYKAGYADTEELANNQPEMVQALLFLTAHWYENRTPMAQMTQSNTPLTVQAAIDLLKIYFI